MDGMQMYTVLSQEKTTSPYFQGVYSRDTLPPLQENMCAIVNSDDSSQPGTHWTHKYRRHEFHPSQGTVSIASPSHQQDIRLCNPLTEESKRGARVKYDKARQTRTTRSKGHSAAEGRPVRSRQTTTVRPCPYYLRSHLKEPEGIPEEQRSSGIDSLPQNSLRRRSLSMETFDRDPVDRSEQRTKKKISLYRFSF
ncbi:uncharacterized protein TNCV_2163311 [Trichonephila clavipes]|nr:uncharacterized protein TNCV_2163311 [Trichonephila clavipes]